MMTSARAVRYVMLPGDAGSRRRPGLSQVNAPAISPLSRRLRSEEGVMTPAAGSTSNPAKPNFCPVCGDPVRPDERFCDKCGATLTPTAGLPGVQEGPVASPPPGGPVAFGAPGGGFQPAFAPARGRSNTGLILGCVAVLIIGVIGVCMVGGLGVALFGGDATPTPALALVVPSAPPVPAATPVPTASPVPTVQPTRTASAAPIATVVSSGLSSLLRTALMGSVLIIAPDDTGKYVASGSGTILTPQGHILTNFHVIGDTDTGRYENKSGLYFVGISSPELNTKPAILYLAQVVKGDKDLDLALLRIVATKDGGKLPADLKLTTVPVGDSDRVQIGDDISVIGFPALGEGTVTFTKGSVSGFVDDSGSTGTWIKTDTEINPGNSGGTAINNKGELVGIPTQVRFDTSVAGKIGKIRPVSFAESLIQLAREDAKLAVSFTFTAWSSTAAVPTPRPGTAVFDKIIICDEAPDGTPVNVRSVFPSGATKVTAFWTFQGMATGQQWGRRWLKDGQVTIDKLGLSWDDEADGWTSWYLPGEPGLEDGNYEFQLYLGTTLVQRATFSIQKAAGATPTPSSVTTGSFGKVVIAQNVTVNGEIVVPTNTFPADTTEVWAYFTYINMKDGQSWGRKWLLDGDLVWEETEAWDGGATGWIAYYLPDPDGLAPGAYEFVLYLGGKEVQRAKFTVGAAARPTLVPSRATATPVPPLAGGITVAIQKYDYSQWGRPEGMDDPNKSCGNFNNGRPVKKLTASLRVENKSGQAMNDWWGYFYKANGQAAYTCYQGDSVFPSVPAGKGLDMTFVVYIEPNETVSYGMVVDEIVGTSNRLSFP
jgi:S1-C subfamily serine protease